MSGLSASRGPSSHRAAHGSDTRLTSWRLPLSPAPRLVAFDLDDTLAPSKSPLDPRMADLLVQLLDVVEVCVISDGPVSYTHLTLPTNREV